MKLRARAEQFPLARTFSISRGSRTVADVVTVSVEANGDTGFGECVPYARYDESIGSVIGAIQSLRLPVDRNELQQCLPPGAARNAVDCALWDLEAKQAGLRVWELAGQAEPEPVVTAYTLSLDDPSEMAHQAARQASRPLLKIKLGGPGDLERLEAVRSGAPAARIIVDANEGWTVSAYERLIPAFLDLGIEMVEQPFPVGEDAVLDEVERPIPVCADESCHDRTSLARLSGRYDMINIKLDKTGGLTEAMALRDLARDRGFEIMVGCMVGTSLAMAPAVLVAQGAAVTDLDGPLLLAADRETALRYEGSDLFPPASGLWG